MAIYIYICIAYIVYYLRIYFCFIIIYERERRVSCEKLTIWLIGNSEFKGQPDC